MVVLIPEGSPAPAKRTIVCTTVADSQRAVEVRVVRGAPGAHSARLAAADPDQQARTMGARTSRAWSRTAHARAGAMGARRS